MGSRAHFVACRTRSLCISQRHPYLIFFSSFYSSYNYYYFVKETQRALRALGLTEHQAKAYATLACLGTAKVYEVAQGAEIPPINTYRVLSDLTRLGGATLLPGRPKQYRASPPDQWLPRLGQQIALQAEQAAQELKRQSRATPPLQKPGIRGMRRIRPLLLEAITRSDSLITGLLTPRELQKLRKPLTDASRRGIQLVLGLQTNQPTLPFPPPAGWIICILPHPTKEGPLTSSWTFDNALSFRVTDPEQEAVGRSMEDPPFTQQLAWGNLARIQLALAAHSPELRRCQRLSDELLNL